MCDQTTGKDCFNNIKIRTSLHTAVIEQETKDVSNLLGRVGEVNVNEIDFYDKTALYYATRSGNLKIVKLLLDAGAAVCKSGFIEAIESQNIEILKLYLNKIKDDQDFGYRVSSFLSTAVQFGNSSIVELLLQEYKANSKTAELAAELEKNPRKNPLLHEAIQTNNLKIIKMLLVAGVNVDTADEFGNSALHLALDSKNHDILQLLIEYQENIDAKNLEGFSPLHYAVKLNSDDKALDILLKAGADPNVKCKNGYTPLITAVELKNERIVRMFLNPDLIIKLNNENNKRSVLHTAVESQNENIVKILLNVGVNASSKNDKGETPLYLAVELQNENIVKLLLAAGNVNTPNHLGNTALNIAINAQDVNENIIKLLLNAGADVNAVDKDGNTPLHVASQYEDLNIIKLFIEAGASLNLWTNDRKTPFMLFVMRCSNMKKEERNECFRLFLEKSDVNLVDVAGKNVLAEILVSGHYAKKRSFFSEPILKRIAVVNFSNKLVDLRLLDVIYNNNEYDEFFELCKVDLEEAKTSRLCKSSVTFLNLIMDDKSKFVKYAGNHNLMKDVEKNALWKFPIYGPTIKRNVNLGIESRKSFDYAKDALSRYLPILNPTNLIIQNILDVVTEKDWKKLCTRKRVHEE